MSDTLFPYYESELLFIRRLAQEFARQYPAAAGRLLLEPNRSQDPHVERLIEAFALLTGRIHRKLDAEFPELIEALLGVLYPHYLAPLPSMAIVQFLLDPTRAQLPRGFRVERGANLLTPPVDGLPCKFRTCYPVTLWPVEVASARLQQAPFPPGLTPPPRTVAVLRLRLQTMAQQRFADLGLDRLRLHLYGDRKLKGELYELLFNHALQVVFRPLDSAPVVARSPDRATTNRAGPLVLTPEECLFQVGFEPDEGMLPYPARSFRGYGLLTEFFTFPSKFMFVDLGGWKQAAAAGYGQAVEVVIFLSRTVRSLEQKLEANNFRTGCTPVINLFSQVAEPIPLTQARHEYRIVPNVHHPLGMEVYSIDEVTGADPTVGASTAYRPFFSFHHGVDPHVAQTFWCSSRRPSAVAGERGTEVFLRLVDLGFRPTQPAESTLVIRTQCSNRDLPAKLQGAGEGLHFSLESPAPLSQIRCVFSPTLPLRPPANWGRYWRLISHLSLNYLSLSAEAGGREALQEMLRLYNFSDPEVDLQQTSVTAQIIEGISELSSRRVIGRTGAETASGFCRGIEVTVEFDEEKYVGTEVFLFACVLERFLGLYASINSFSQLVGKLKNKEGYFKKWPPRAGEQHLL